MAERWKENDRYKYAMENIHDIIWEINKDLIFLFISPNSKELSGYEPEEMLGRCLLDFLSAESKEYILNQIKKNLQDRISGILKKPILYEIQFVDKIGEKTWFEVSSKPLFEDGMLTGFIGTSRDISEKKVHEGELKKYIEELERANKRLDDLTTFDMLTGAYSRRKFEQEAILFADRKVREGSPFAVIMFDIDFFKLINDRYGHKMGDRILQEVTLIVKNMLRDTDRLFRWGGDEFVVLLQDTATEDAHFVAERIRKIIEDHKFAIEGENITISLGVGEFLDGDSLDPFISYVDNALMQAKINGKNRIELRS